MPKKYKLPMFILAGLGLLMLIGGFSLLKEDPTTGIFGIVLGILVGVPMLALYPYFAKKRKKAIKKAQKLAKKKEAEEAAKNNYIYTDVDVDKKALPYLKKKTTPEVTIKPYRRKDTGEFFCAVIFDNEEKVGEIIEEEAEDIKEALQKGYIYQVNLLDWDTDVNPETGEKSYSISLRIWIKNVR